MIRRCTAVLALGLTIVVGSATAASAAEVFTTTLSGAEEAPNPGDPDGSGFAIVAAIPEAGLVCYAVVVFGIGPATAAHIHEAPRGVAGPVVVGLDAPSRGASTGCVADAEEAADIAVDPDDYYVNVHKPGFAGGAIRGQLG